MMMMMMMMMTTTTTVKDTAERREAMATVMMMTAAAMAAVTMMMTTMTTMKTMEKAQAIVARKGMIIFHNNGFKYRRLIEEFRNIQITRGLRIHYLDERPELTVT